MATYTITYNPNGGEARISVATVTAARRANLRGGGFIFTLEDGSIRGTFHKGAKKFHSIIPDMSTLHSDTVTLTEDTTLPGE